MHLIVGVADEQQRLSLQAFFDDVSARNPGWSAPVRIQVGAGDLILCRAREAADRRSAHPSATLLVGVASDLREANPASNVFYYRTSEDGTAADPAATLLGIVAAMRSLSAPTAASALLRQSDKGVAGQRYVVVADAVESNPRVVRALPVLLQLREEMSRDMPVRLAETWVRLSDGAVTPPEKPADEEFIGQLDSAELGRWPVPPEEKLDTPAVGMATLAEAMVSAVAAKAGRLDQEKMRKAVTEGRERVDELMQKIRAAAVSGDLSLPEVRAVLKRVASGLAEARGAPPPRDDTVDRAGADARRWIAEEWQYVKAAMSGPTKAAAATQSVCFGVAMGAIVALVPFTGGWLGSLGPPLGETRLLAAGATILATGLVVGMLHIANRAARISTGHDIITSMQGDVARLDRSLAKNAANALDRLGRAATADGGAHVAAVLEVLGLAEAAMRHDLLPGRITEEKKRVDAWERLKPPWSSSPSSEPSGGAGADALRKLNAAWVQSALATPPDRAVLLVGAMQSALEASIDPHVIGPPGTPPEVPHGFQGEKAWLFAGSDVALGAWKPCSALPNGMWLSFRVEVSEA